MRQMPDACIDSIVTDPPYELGFMGKSWDNAGIAYSVEMWTEALRILKPGGHLLAFGATRTYHRMACAIEDAGFEIRDSIHWVYGSGFPKSLNVGKAITAHQITGGSQPKNLRQVRQGDDYKPTGQVDYSKGRAFGSEIEDDNRKTELTTDGQQWAGWGTALKPAHEPIVVGGASRYFYQAEPDDLDGPPFFYTAKANKKERNSGVEDANKHPTVKPVALMRYLVRLVTPPGGRVFDPFLGSGTTAVAAILEGMEWFGTEMTEEYYPIIEGRIAWAEEQMSSK